MVRPTGGSSSSRRAAPSAQEMMNAIGRDIFGDDFQGGVTASSKGEFNRISDIMFDDDQSMNYYNPTTYANWAGEDYRTKKGDITFGRSTYELIDFNQNMNLEQLNNKANFRIPGFQPDEMEDDSPADITVVPTSTTNPDRPRTVAAGYDEEEEKLTVIFRDGTFYNYYEVSGGEWAAFKANRSKGAIIARMLDFKPRGPANISDLSTQAQKAFYRYSRGAQIAVKGKVPGQTKTMYKTIAQSKRGKNPSTGGKNPRGR
jgi:hypothetical protein